MNYLKNLISEFKKTYFPQYPNDKRGRNQFIKALKERNLSDMGKVRFLMQSGQDVIFKTDNGIIPLAIVTKNRLFSTMKGNTSQKNALEYDEYDDWIFKNILNFYKNDVAHPLQQKQIHLLSVIESTIHLKYYNERTKSQCYILRELINALPEKDKALTSLLFDFCKSDYLTFNGDNKDGIDQVIQAFMNKGANLYCHDSGLLELIVQNNKSSMLKILLQRDVGYQFIENQQLLKSLELSIRAHSQPMLDSLLNHLQENKHKKMAFDFLTQQKSSPQGNLFSNWSVMRDKALESLKKDINFHHFDNALPQKKKEVKKQKI